MADRAAFGPPGLERAVTCAALDPRVSRAALDIWREAAQWLADAGRPLWPPAIFDDGFLTDAHARGVVLGAAIDGRLAGVALLQWRDDLWWPDRPADGAAYVHKVAVARAAAGRGVADALVAESERRARSRGIGILRLDTARDRPKLCALYERLGFRPIDVRTVGSFVGVRFEKQL
jgi:GNAT superfamily N-acetyltransferase